MSGKSIEARDGETVMMRGRTVDATGEPLVVTGNGEGPVIAAALHAGHSLRAELDDYVGLAPDARLREEDPCTDMLAPRGIPLLAVLRSRFEVDLNRPRERAVYTGPEDAWGLDLYRSSLPEHVSDASRRVYDVFYDVAHEQLSEAARQHGRFVVLDLHSYNHRRGGVDAPAASVDDNPEINLGTGWLDRARWAPVVDAFTGVMGGAGFDCRENVKFRGGYFARWVSETFPECGAVLAIEFKKTYIDEWTGQVDETAVERIRAALETAVPRLTVALDRVM